MPLPRFETKESEGYKTVHATGAIGTLNPGEGSIIFFVDRIVPSTNPDGTMSVEKIVRELLIEIKLSPLQFKALANMMIAKVREYEQRFGEIKMPAMPGQSRKDVEKFFHT